MSDLGDSSNEEAAADQKPAGYGKRVLGAIIDFLIVAVIYGVPTVVFFIGLVSAGDASDKGEPTTTAASMMMILGGVAGLAALVWAIWLFGYRQGVTGLTPGKRRLGIHLVDGDSGLVPGGAKGVGRWLIPLIVGGIQGIGSALQLIDILWPLWDAKNQRLIDKIFKTRVLVGSPAVVDDGPPLPESPIS